MLFYDTDFRTMTVPEAPNATTAGRNITANTTMRQSPTAAGAIVDDGDGKDASVTILIGVVVAVVILGAVIGGGVAVACASANQRGTLTESIEGKGLSDRYRLNSVFAPDNEARTSKPICNIIRHIDAVSPLPSNLTPSADDSGGANIGF